MSERRSPPPWMQMTGVMIVLPYPLYQRVSLTFGDG